MSMGTGGRERLDVEAAAGVAGGGGHGGEGCEVDFDDGGVGGAGVAVHPGLDHGGGAAAFLDEAEGFGVGGDRCR